MTYETCDDWGQYITIDDDIECTLIKTDDYSQNKYKNFSYTTYILAHFMFFLF